MDLFKFLNVATIKTDKMSLQELVDEHARLGMLDIDIGPHLVKLHDIDQNILIPPPSRAAQRKRDRLQEEGVAAITMSADEASISTSDANSSEFLKEAFLQAASASGIDREQIDVTSQDRYDETMLIEKWYVGTGPTLLDRIVHGFGKWFRDENGSDLIGGESNFEIYRDKTRHVYNNGGYNLNYRKNDDSIEQLVHAALHPWFAEKTQTQNYQLSADLADLLCEAKPPANDRWMEIATRAPMYIDIHGLDDGERGISGIFVTPDEDKKGFTFTMIFEWSRRGFESVISAHYPLRDDDPAIIMNTSNKLFPQDVQEQLYGTPIDDIQHLIAVFCAYIQSGKAIEAASIMTQTRTGGPGTDQEKKQRNQEKTHSYFVMRRIEQPADRFGMSEAAMRSRWSLDHIISVAGHLRWQACGPGMQQNKLIWIDAHEKGEGARVRPETNPVLNRVKKGHRGTLQ